MTSKPPFGGEVVRLGELCSKGKSSLRQKDVKNDGPYPVYGASGVVGSMSSYQNEKPYVAIVKDGAGVGRAMLCAGKSSVLGTMQALLPNEDTNLSYLLHLVRSLKLGEGYSGSTIPHIYFKDYGKRAVPALTAERQTIIARNLDSIERLSELLDAQIASLDSLVKSRFVEMFGDPVANPMGWETDALGRLGTCKNGLNFKAEDSGFEVPCLGVGDFGDRACIDDLSILSKVSLSERPKQECFLRDGDIVFVRSNGNKALVGRCLAVYPHGSDLVYSGFCIRFRLEEDVLRVPFLVWTLKQPSMRNQLMGRGSNVKNLNQRILSSLEVPIPPIELQDEFISFASRVDKLRVDAQEQKEKLQTLYDSLAQDYFAI